PAGIEAFEAVRDAADLGQQLALQPSGSAGWEIQLDGVGEPAIARLDYRGNFVIGSAGGEDLHDIVWNLGRHVVPLADDRHRVQFRADLLQTVQSENRRVGAGRRI